MYRGSNILIAMFAVSTVMAQQTVTYNASSGVLPDDSSLGVDTQFQVERSSSELSESIINGDTLLVDDSGPLGKVSYWREIPAIEPYSTFSYEVEVRVVRGGGGSIDTAIATGLNDSSKLMTLGMSPTAVGFYYPDDGGWVAKYDLDTTDTFHTYRVVKDSSDFLQVYVDEMTTPVIDIAYSALATVAYPGRWPTGKADLLQTGQLGNGSAELKYFTYTVVPEPMTLVGMLACGFLIRRR